MGENVETGEMGIRPPSVSIQTIDKTTSKAKAAPIVPTVPIVPIVPARASNDSHISRFPFKGKRFTAIFRTSPSRGNALQAYFVVPLQGESLCKHISYFPFKGKRFASIFRRSPSKGIALQAYFTVPLQGEMLYKHISCFPFRGNRFTTESRASKVQTIDKRPQSPNRPNINTITNQIFTFKKLQQ